MDDQKRREELLGESKRILAELKLAEEELRAFAGRPTAKKERAELEEKVSKLRSEYARMEREFLRDVPGAERYLEMDLFAHDPVAQGIGAMLEPEVRAALLEAQLAYDRMPPRTVGGGISPLTGRPRPQMQVRPSEPYTLRLLRCRWAQCLRLGEATGPAAVSKKAVEEAERALGIESRPDSQQVEAIMRHLKLEPGRKSEKRVHAHLSKIHGPKSKSRKRHK